MYFILFFVLFQFNFVNLKIKFKLHCNSGEQRKAKKKRNFFSLPSKRNQFSSKTFSFVLSIKKQRKEWKKRASARSTNLPNNGKNTISNIFTEEFNKTKCTESSVYVWQFDPLTIFCQEQ